MIKRTCAVCGVSEIWGYINEEQLCEVCGQQEKERVNETGRRCLKYGT